MPMVGWIEGIAREIFPMSVDAPQGTGSALVADATNGSHGGDSDDHDWVIEEGHQVTQRANLRRDTEGPRALWIPFWPGDSAYSGLYLYATTLTRVPMLNGYSAWLDRSSSRAKHL